MRFFRYLTVIALLSFTLSITTSKEQGKINSIKTEQVDTTALLKRNTELKAAVKKGDTSIIKNLSSLETTVNNIVAQKQKIKIIKLQGATAMNGNNCIPDTVVRWYKEPNLFQRIFPKLFKNKHPKL